MKSGRATELLMNRDGNGLDADWIVLFPYLFLYFKKEYGCKYGYYQI
jgi:hypothetical protein